MKWLIIAILLVAVVYFYLRLNRPAPNRSIQGGTPGPPWIDADDLRAVQRAVDDDITVLGEVLQSLDKELAGQSLSDAMQRRYERALDDYEAAKESRATVTAAADVRAVAQHLEHGRYMACCLRAEAAGEHRPEHRSPCFFDPAHGPSESDVAWAPGGAKPREVPVCRQDADRLVESDEPAIRHVGVGTGQMPYWQAGPAFAPWVIGYYSAFVIMRDTFADTRMGRLVGGADPHV
ncbi:MAG: hypothetical protein ACRDQA_11050 [Nocardioidaceae bacterium]